MSNLVVSLNRNHLKITLNEKNEFKKAMAELPDDVVRDSEIVDIDLFSSALSNLLGTLHDVNRKKAEVTFLVQPSDVILRFLTLSKNQNEANSPEHFIQLIKEKVSEINLENYYFSYQKIAPFVYQFVAIEKAKLEKYLEVANKAELSLKAVVPWDVLLPKFLNDNDPCVFLVQDGHEQTLALSELNGIYFTETFNSAMTGVELRELIEKLSVYKRNRPIKKVYTITDKEFELEGYEVEPLLVLISDFRDAEGYEIHLLTEEVMSSNPEYYATQINLLTLLPMPVEVKRNLVPFYAGVGAFLLLALIGAGIYAFGFKSSDDNGELANNTQNTPVVLSEQEPAEPEVEEKQEEVQELNKADLSIRVLNGAGIPGVAGEMQTFLEEKGYTVESVGNAETQDFTDTVVRMKADASKYTDVLISDLQEERTGILYDEEVLDEAEPYDVLLIVGVSE